MVTDYCYPVAGPDPVVALPLGADKYAHVLQTHEWHHPDKYYTARVTGGSPAAPRTQVALPPAAAQQYPLEPLRESIFLAALPSKYHQYQHPSIASTESDVIQSRRHVEYQ